MKPRRSQLEPNPGGGSRCLPLNAQRPRSGRGRPGIESPLPPPQAGRVIRPIDRGPTVPNPGSRLCPAGFPGLSIGHGCRYQAAKAGAGDHKRPEGNNRVDAPERSARGRDAVK